MKYIFLLLIIITNNSLACTIGPEIIRISKEHGFNYQITPSIQYKSTDEIRITAPMEFKDMNFDIGVFTVFFDDQIISRSAHSYINEDGQPEFLGYASNSEKHSYKVSFLYGEGMCKRYEFELTNSMKLQ